MTTQIYATAVTTYYLDAVAAFEAGGPILNIAGGTLVVGDGNGVVPSLSALLAAGGVTNEVWRGQTVQSVSVDAAVANQLDIQVAIPVALGGVEIGPFTVREFAILDDHAVEADQPEHSGHDLIGAGAVVAVDQHDFREGLADPPQRRPLSLEAEANQMFGEVGLSGDARPALLGKHRQEALRTQPVDHLAGRNVGVTGAAAFMRLRSERRRRQPRDLIIT